MTFKVIDKFLSENNFNKIVDNTIYNENFSLYMKSGTSYTRKDGMLYNNDGMYLNHLFFKDGNINSEAYFLIEPLLDKINPEKILRIQLNVYPKTFFIKKHGWHTDFDFKHNGCILYLNTNNGKTILKNNPFDIKIKSVRNRVLFFDPSIKHRSTTCTNLDFRSNIIINYI